MRRTKDTATRAKTTLKCAGAIVAAVSLFAAITAVTFPRQRMLLQRAKRIAPASFLWAGKYRVSYPCYWLSNEKAMTLQQPSVRHLALPSGLLTHAASLSAVTGAYQPMPDFTKSVTAHLPHLTAELSFIHAKSFFVNMPCSVSPSGEWAVLTEITGSRCWPSTLRSRHSLLALNGFRHVHGKWRDGETHVLWEPDSRSWLEWNYAKDDVLKVVTHFTEGAENSYAISLPANLVNHNLYPCAVTQKRTILAEIEAPDLTGTSEETPAPVCICKLAEIPITGAAPLRRSTVSLPNLTNITRQSVLFSPRCDKIAWLVTYRYELTGPKLWQQLRIRLGDKPHLETAIWVSRLDGTAAHEIGHIAHPPDAARPEQLAWLPSGKQLSFSYRGDLYTVPAD